MFKTLLTLTITSALFGISTSANNDIHTCGTPDRIMRGATPVAGDTAYLKPAYGWNVDTFPAGTWHYDEAATPLCDGCLNSKPSRPSDLFEKAKKDHWDFCWW